MKVNQEFLTLVLLGHVGTLPHNKSPFDYLHTDEGFNNAKAYFLSIANSNADEEGDFFNENQFINFLRKLTDFNDYQILEIYDTFDVRMGEPSGIRFEEYFFILAVLGSRDHGQMTKFLYLHGRDMFDILVNRYTGEVFYDKFRRLGFLLGIPETFILARLWDYKLNAFSSFDYDSFMLYYFDLLSSVDDWIKQNELKDTDDIKVKAPRCAVS